jgi:hypothetical protein
MARLQADEDFRAPIAHRLRELGHEVLSAHEAGLANAGLGDEAILLRATADRRALLTHNRSDFLGLHRALPAHGGIVTCRQDADALVLAEQIHAALKPLATTENLLIRVYLNGPPRVEGRPTSRPENQDG